MYRCEICSAVVPPKTSRQLVVVLKPVVHPVRRGVIRRRIFEKGKWLWKKFDDPGGEGTQIDQEIVCCPKCKQENTKVELA